MAIGSAIVLFAVVWFMTLFVVLPLRLTSEEAIALPCAFLCLFCACASGGPASGGLEVVLEITGAALTG